MPSQFFGLNIAYKGLLASNAALNTTSNNIANVQTEGYSRQQVVQQASDALRVFQTYGCAGAGVDTIAIERIRDEFYDTKYWDSSTNLGEYNIKQYYMSQLETYFSDDGTTTGFKTIFDQFTITGLQAVLKDASSTTTKAQFIGYAGELTEYFNGLASNMEKVQKDVNQELKLKVDEINSLASEIASLNKQINVIELTGSKANELRDRRTLLLDQLSAIVDIETQEIPIKDPHNPDYETGANRFLLKIGGGQLLLDTADYKQLECIARTTYEKVNQTDIDGLYDIYWADGEQFNIYDKTLGGALQGLVEMRDGNNTENFTGMITDTGKTDVTDREGNVVSHDTVTIEVSKDYLQDLNKCNLSDTGGIINLGNQLFYYDSWSYTCSYDAAGKATYSYTFVLSDSTLNDRSLTNDRVGKSASIGNSIDYQGVPYYMKQMNEWVRTFSQKFNDILNDGYDIYGNLGNDLFAGKMATSNEQYDFADQYRYDTQTDGTVTVGVNDASYYKLTASNFSILSALVEDADLLATRKDVSDGVEQYDVLTELQDMINDKTKMSYRGSKAGEFLQCILSDVALNASNANTFATNYENISKSVDNQRISISGVDEDEEAVNLVKYQNGYNLASKMIQTLTEIYDRLILQTGV
ncbi:MAG: flagellar hook-associated protein FlgK [Lachnospiraceae bacterium]|nr:flagellar hook-associated protein FlgK [Lachnospiraceae bacterium]